MSRRGLTLSLIASMVALGGCGDGGNGQADGRGGRGGAGASGPGGGAAGAAAVAGTSGTAGTSGDAGASGAGGMTGAAGASGASGAGVAGTGGAAGSGGTGAGGTTFVSDPWCLPGNAKAVVACGLFVATSLALYPTGQAFVSLMDDTGGVRVVHWDNTGTWKYLVGVATPTSNMRGSVLRVDAQGRPVIAFFSRNLSVQRWTGTGWSSLGVGLPATGNEGRSGVDLEIDALDRPVLLLNTPIATGRNQISVLRLEGGTWVQLGDAPYVNSMASAEARLALDSADGITPHVAYKPVDDNKSIVSMRFEGTGWSSLPALARGLDADFDFAVAGGQTVLVYLDGPTVVDARVFVSQGSASGWSPGVALNADTNLPVWRPRILATGPAEGDLIVAYEEQDTTSGKYRSSLKRAPDWASVLIDVPPTVGANMSGVLIAADSSRLGLAWTSGVGPSFVGYHDFAR